MNRVLEAERAAQSAVEDCEKQCLALIEDARQRRRNILERAHERIVALHTQAAQALGQRNPSAGEPRGDAGTTILSRHADHARTPTAIEKLADLLTSVLDREVEGHGHRG